MTATLSSTDRIANFGAGPAVLPEPVLRQAQRDLWNIGGSGIGILEHSHRGKLFERIVADAEEECRRLAGIPDHYRVLFLQGGASLQFAMVPMNLLSRDATADYLVTGSWSQKAVKEAQLLGNVHIALTGEAQQFTRIPPVSELRWSQRPVYAHITTNNTIYGTQWREEPPVPDDVPLIADASSDIFSRPLDVSRYGLIYAGAQKNLGPSGIVLVLVRDDLVERGATGVPTMLQYRTHARERSLYNTPPTFAVYVVGLVLRWIREIGGLEAMAERNREKAALLYDYLDQSPFFRPTAHPESRSLMNVCFRSPTEALDAEFIAQAARLGLDGLKGHRSAGGMRASLYNACSRENVARLVEFMRGFEAERRGGR